MDAHLTLPEPAQRALAAQGLTAADLDANRAGRVSPAQLARLGNVQKGGQATVYVLFGGGSVISVVTALFHYSQHGDAPIFVLPAIAIAFALVIYFLVYRRNRLPLPAEIENAKVTVMHARVGGSLIASARGVYNVWLDNVRYTGCATALSDEVRKKDRVVDAYVIAERKLVVALVPAE
jgi:hypothetical protein